MPGGESETFYMSLLRPMMTEEYLDKVQFFLSAGPDAPLKDPALIDNMTHESLQRWVDQLSEMYKQQKEAMERQKARKASSRHR